MLPTINLDLASICAPSYDLNRGRHTFIGYAFAYYFNQVVTHAQQKKKSLDRILTELVLGGMTGHPVKTKVLFWFSATRDLLFLTVCDIRQRVYPKWLHDLAGYMESGSSYLYPNARPFLYWDGNNLTRVYPPPGHRGPGRALLCDLGSLPDYVVGWGNKLAAEGVRLADPEYTVYSIVPDRPDEMVTIGQRKCVLSHAFYALQFPPEP